MYRAVRRQVRTARRRCARCCSRPATNRSLEAAPNDSYWGEGRDGNGQNKLGKIIERIRAELRDGELVGEP